jgi:hypothetical protein
MKLCDCKWRCKDLFRSVFQLNLRCITHGYNNSLKCGPSRHFTQTSWVRRLNMSRAYPLVSDVDLNFCVIKFMYDTWLYVVIISFQSQESSVLAILPYIPLVTQCLLAPKPRIVAPVKRRGIMRAFYSGNIEAEHMNVHYVVLSSAVLIVSPVERASVDKVTIMKNQSSAWRHSRERGV